MSRDKALVVQQRREFYEIHCRLEQFAHPEDSYEEVAEEDARLDMQIRAFRNLTRQSCFA